ncbi:MAG: hypothetical protein SFW36_17260, partial [Leptolyngbyaceae cyanobacterium bins.59]|nr:hypothetical protein [Leptolyngbyaceae cyanobacterium bins.59]
MSNRRWLDIAEYASLSGSVVGAVASLVSQQAVYASAPLSLCILFNILNRQKLQRQMDQTVLSGLKDLDQRLNQEHQSLQGLRRSVLALPTPDDLGQMRESIAQGNRETLAQFSAELSIAKSQLQARFVPLEALDLNPLQQQVTQLGERQNHLITSVAEVVENLTALAPSDQVERLAGSISELFEKTVQLEEGLQQLADQPPPDLTPLENQLEQLQQQILNLPPPYNPSFLEERVQLLTQEVEKSLQTMANLVSRQDLSAIFTELEKLRQRHQGLSQSFSP